MDFFNKHNAQTGYGLSYELWKNFPITEILALRDRNVGWGFFDDFTTFHATTIEGPWAILEGTGCTVEQTASEANAIGLVRLSIDGNAANDEAVMSYGRGLSADYKLASRDLCFEVRFRVSAITAAKWAWFIGLSEAACATTDHMFVDSTGVMADYNHCGFAHLYAEGGAVDGAYKADGQTYQDGAANTKLDTLHTMVASTFVTLGMRYRASLNALLWYVNGVQVSAAKLTSAELSAATFPDDVFLTPVVAIKDIAGNAALTLDVDWIACAQQA